MPPTFPADLRQEVGELKVRTAGDIVVAGSAQRVEELIALDLVDQFNPMAFETGRRSGKRIFADGIEALTFAIADVKQSRAVVILTARRTC